MASFPKDEQSTIVLATDVSEGIERNATTFPSPPVPATEMKSDLAAYHAKQGDIQAAEAQLRLEIQEKNEIYLRIRKATRRNVNYGEDVAQGDEAILDMINWGTRADPQRLQAPGQCRALEIIGQGTGWVRLDWKEPVDGGDVASYKIQRSEDGEHFTNVDSAVDSIAALFEQPTAKKLFYRVVAINRAGEGMPSNTVNLTL
jgi:hypothetical protein